MITLNDAKKMPVASEKKATEIGQPMNIAVVDSGGNLIAHERMDGAWIGIDISIKKAFTSRAFDISTRFRSFTIAIYGIPENYVTEYKFLIVSDGRYLLYHNYHIDSPAYDGITAVEEKVLLQQFLMFLMSAFIIDVIYSIQNRITCMVIRVTKWIYLNITSTYVC
jgi:Haem degrading protein HbpS-like